MGVKNVGGQAIGVGERRAFIHEATEGIGHCSLCRRSALPVVQADTAHFRPPSANTWQERTISRVRAWGLAIYKKIVERHGGSITAKSRLRLRKMECSI